MASASSLREVLQHTLSDKVVALTIFVSALGYFVDVFDLLLFSIVRMQSLRDLGVSEAELLSVGIRLLNIQMAGLLLGGILWGVIGDKLGRVSVLFGSIILYSLANIGNGFVTSVEQYSILRFITGLGLAGELGVGVTLASELLPKRLRGIGTTFIVLVGVLGATCASVVADMVDWRTAYIIGGIMGLCLLALRVKVRESGLYKKVSDKKNKVSRGNLMVFFRRPELLRQYLSIILIGAPIWASIGIFITFTPEFAKDFGMTVLPNTSKAVFYFYVGTSFGAAFSGGLSQYLCSRRKSIAVSLCFLMISTGLFVAAHGNSLLVYYSICGLLGFSSGYWTMFVQMGAEQFGTNIRATAATSIPNVVRGLTIPMTAGFHALIPVLGVTSSGLVVMVVTLVLAFASLWSIRETFHVDLDYIDHGG